MYDKEVEVIERSTEDRRKKKNIEFPALGGILLKPYVTLCAYDPMW